MELINWIWFAGAIASAATLGIADGKARNIQPIEALWLALLWVTETLLLHRAVENVTRLRARLARHRKAAQSALYHLLCSRRRRGEAYLRMSPDR